MHAIAPYLPHLRDLAAVAFTWGVALVLLCAGAAMLGPRQPPEIRLVAGWGALCLLLTLWGVFVPLSLRLPAVGFVALALLAQAVPRRRLRSPDIVALGRVLVISLPMWLVLAPIRPSQPDTFLNLLPNAMYLVDYGRLPTAALPPSHSLLPAAPYNTQFMAFLGALADGVYPGPGMSLLNAMLLLVGGLAIARALATQAGLADAAPPWGLTALGLLLATLLNPGFVPRIHLSPFGETALAVTAVLAAWQFVQIQGRLAAGRPAGGIAALELILAAMIETKQSGFGLVASLAGAALLAGWWERAVPRRRLLLTAALALVPAVLLFAVWRYFVGYAGVAELMALPWREWNWAMLPATLASIGKEMFQKATYFGCVVIALGALPLQLRRRGWCSTTRLLAFHAALFALYNGFLLLTYIAHFSPEMSEEAHSYFRYNTHLSLVLVLALALLAQQLGLGAWVMRHRRPLSAAVLAVAVATPIGFIVRLRFDLRMPQPLVWRLADRAKPFLADGERLALLLPGDNGSLAAMLAGALTDAAPRRRLDLWTRDRADPATLAAAARLGYRHALISCTPAGTAALLADDGDGWREIAAWSYPKGAMTQRWQDIISWRPLCRRR
jgi:hypothetical protein